MKEFQITWDEKNVVHSAPFWAFNPVDAFIRWLNEGPVGGSQYYKDITYIKIEEKTDE